ncbi:MAG: vWA domain-containing protein [Polyangia bacterium]
MNEMLGKSTLQGFFSMALLLAACEPTAEIGRDDDDDGAADADSDADSDTDGDADADSDADGDADTGTFCDEQDFPISLVPPRLMLLVDFSFSMTDPIDPDALNPQDKWPVARQALIEMVTGYGGQLHFGTDIFPDGSGSNKCEVDDPVEYDIQLDSGSAIISYYTSASTPNGNGTPLYCGMQNFLDPTYAPVFNDPEAPSYLVVVSDGADLCGTGCFYCGPFNQSAECDDIDVELGELTAQLYDEQGIRTFAIGFGDDAVSADVAEDQLGAIAANGHTDVDQYLDAADEEALYAALDVIAESAVSCTYSIDEPDASADPDNVNFYFEVEGAEEVVPYDEDCQEGLGWTWIDEEHTEIEFCEQPCQQLQTGEVTEISAKFGCPTVVVE